MIIRRISLFLHAYAAENQVEAAAEAGDITRTIELADSFVNKNLLSSVRANFYKAMAFNRIEDYPAMAEYIRKIVKAYEDGSDEDPLFYSRAAISLSGYYVILEEKAIFLINKGSSGD